MNATKNQFLKMIIIDKSIARAIMKQKHIVSMRTNEKISLWIPQNLKSSLCHKFVTLAEIEQFLERPYQNSLKNKETKQFFQLKTLFAQYKTSKKENAKPV